MMVMHKDMGVRPTHLTSLGLTPMPQRHLPPGRFHIVQQNVVDSGLPPPPLTTQPG